MRKRSLFRGFVQWVILVFLIMSGDNMLHAQLFSPHTWEDRLILLHAGHQGVGEMEAALDLLKEKQAEVIDRDLKVYQFGSEKGFSPDGSVLSKEQVEWFKGRYQPDKNGFTWILIGKDGGEKDRGKEVESLNRIFGLIDQMPMRRSEMRRNKG